MLRRDARLTKDYEELIGYGKLETIEEVTIVDTAVSAAAGASAPNPECKKSDALPFLVRLGSSSAAGRMRRWECHGVLRVAR